MTTDLLDRAQSLLAANTREGTFRGRRYVFTVPSPTVYPFQWFWDSCFHAIVWARIDLERSKEELRSLFAHQAGSGLIPQIVLWDRALVDRRSWHYLETPGRLDWILDSKPWATAQIQPPLIAQAVEAIVAAGGDDFLLEALPALERHYRFLARERDPDADGLISIISRYESGLDFNPVYDPRPGRDASPRLPATRARFHQLPNKLLGYDLGSIFRLTRTHCEDLVVNGAFVDGLQALARLSALAGRPELERWAAGRAEIGLAALLDRCYDARRGLFFNLAGPQERRVDGVTTIVSLIPLLIPDLPAEVASSLVGHLGDPREFWTEYPVPSVAADDPSFRPDSRLGRHRRIWRGPCSMSTNWLLLQGLRRHGRDDLAAELADRCRTLAARRGFNEFYNPLDGTPVGTPGFGWATLAAVM